VFRAFAALFKQARQQRVTDKGKEKPGTKPAPFYGPRARASANESSEELLLEGRAEATTSTSTAGAGMSAAGAGTSAAGAGTSAAGTGSSAAGAGAERLAPVYRHGDVVIVRPLRSQFWLAQLLEPIIEVSPGRFNVDRPRCRYFVPTAELAAYTHAIKWWQGRGAQLRLADEAAAIARSSESDGVHFSFEQTDHVTRSTICGRLEPSCLSERLFFNHELISFAISEHEFELARELVSGIATTEAEAGPSLEDVEAAAGQAAQAQAEEDQAAVAKAAHVAGLAQKRKDGKAREVVQQEASRARKDMLKKES
jgi:hypothetical protein